MEGGREGGVGLRQPHGCAYLRPAHEGTMVCAIKRTAPYTCTRSSETSSAGGWTPQTNKQTNDNDPFCVQIQDGGNVSSSTSESSVTVELSKETLDTMLDGLGRIRDQLSAVAGK